MENNEDTIMTKVVKYEDLSNDLKDEVIENFRSDEFLIYDDWYQWIWEDFILTCKEQNIYIDEDSLQFDMNYKINLEYTGNIDDNVAPFNKFKSINGLDTFESNELVYDISTSFKAAEMEIDYSMDRNIIYEEIENEIFPDGVNVNQDGNVELSLEYLADIKKWATKMNKTTHPFIKTLIDSLSTLELFFQTEYLVSEEEYNDFLDEMTDEAETTIEGLVDNYFKESNLILTQVYDTLGKNLQSSYDYYFTDEYAEENLKAKTFEVETVNGNDVIYDLNGNY